MVSERPIILATPHRRSDFLELRLKHILPNRDIIRFRSPDDFLISNLKQLNPEYVFFPHWSWTVPDKIFNNYECIIFHMTDLPFGRGGTPLQNLIHMGIYETKVSAIKCIKEIDSGPVYTKMPLSLYGTAEEVYLRAGTVIEHMIINIINNKLQPVDQTGDPTYFKRRTPFQGDLGLADSLEKAFDMIRMLDADGYPRAYIDFGKFHMEFSRSSFKGDSVVADVSITERINFNRSKI